MIYRAVDLVEALSQGDIIDNCPLVFWSDQTPAAASEVEESRLRVIVLTQACDLAQRRTERVVVAVVYSAAQVVEVGRLKAQTVRDQVRRHSVYGWYFLPAGLSLPESLVDLRDLHTMPRALLESLIANGKRVCRLATPYREHMAQHFSTTYSRIALPEPYDTSP